MNILISKKKCLKLFAYIVVTVLISATFVSHAVDNYQDFLNTDLPDTYHNLVTTTFEKCKEACDADHLNCKALSWNKENTVCSLKVAAAYNRRQYDTEYNSAAKISVPKSNVMLMSAVDDFEHLPNTYLADTTYHRLITPSLEQCKKHCNADQPKCKAVTWSKENTVCELKVGSQQGKSILDYMSATKKQTKTYEYKKIDNINLIAVETFVRVITNTFSKCKKVCDAQQSRCKAVSWNKSNHVCELKSALGGQREYDRNYISAEVLMSAKDGYHDFLKTNLLDKTYRRFITPSFDECQDSCNEDQPNCKALSWNKENTVCELKVSANNLQLDDDYDSAHLVEDYGTPSTTSYRTDLLVEDYGTPDTIYYHDELKTYFPLAEDYGNPSTTSYRTDLLAEDYGTPSTIYYHDELKTYFPNGNIKTVMSPSFNDCKKTCAEISACNALSWNKNTQECDLKAFFDIKQYNPEYDSALKFIENATVMLKSVPSDYLNYKDTELLSNVYRKLKARNFDECKQACDAEQPICKAVSWYKKTDICELKISYAHRHQRTNAHYDSAGRVFVNYSVPPINEGYVNFKKTKLHDKTYRTIKNKKTMTECKQACNAEQPNCKAVLWNKKTNICELKSGSDHQKYDANYHAAKRLSELSVNELGNDSEGFFDLKDTFLPNFTYRNIQTKNFDECKQACNIDTGCRALSWQKNSKNCELKIDFGHREKNNAYDSAVKVATLKQKLREEF